MNYSFSTKIKCIVIKTTEYFNGIISIIEQLNNLYDNFNDSYESHYFDETNSYVVVLETENDEHRDVAFFSTQKFAEQFSFSLIRSFTELAFS